jgi:hypothetical protein
MTKLVNSSPALARVTSDSTGAFRVSISSTDSVFIFETGNNEDQPFYYSYKTMSGRSSLSFSLDMIQGDCSR